MRAHSRLVRFWGGQQICEFQPDLTFENVVSDCQAWTLTGGCWSRTSACPMRRRSGRWCRPSSAAPGTAWSPPSSASRFVCCSASAGTVLSPLCLTWGWLVSCLLAFHSDNLEFHPCGLFMLAFHSDNLEFHPCGLFMLAFHSDNLEFHPCGLFMLAFHSENLEFHPCGLFMLAFHSENLEFHPCGLFMLAFHSENLEFHPCGLFMLACYSENLEFHPCGLFMLACYSENPELYPFEP